MALQNQQRPMDECKVSAPVKQGSVESELCNLQDANCATSCLIDSLFSRLTDILGEPSECCEEKSPQPPQPNSNLGCSIRDASNQVRNSCDRLHELLTRIEL